MHSVDPSFFFWDPSFHVVMFVTICQLHLKDSSFCIFHMHCATNKSNKFSMNALV